MSKTVCGVGYKGTGKHLVSIKGIHTKVYTAMCNYEVEIID